MTELSNSLADLAERIKETNAAVLVAQRQTIEKAFEAGFLLCQAKEQCPHGEWLPFLKRAGTHERQARRLMQIASCGLTIGHVSEIGGVRAVLDYISNLAVPKAGDLLFVCRADPIDGELVSAWIEHAPDHPGFFNVTAIRSDGTCVRTSKPANGETVRCPDRFFNGLWCTLEMVLDIPHDEREFVTMPAEALDDVDDCPFLDDVHLPANGSFPAVGTAPLPLSYLRVSEAVDLCERDLTPERVIAMQRALDICTQRERKWPSDDARMMGTYARIAADHLPERVGRIMAMAKIKWGSLPA